VYVYRLPKGKKGDPETRSDLFSDIADEVDGGLAVHWPNETRPQQYHRRPIMTNVNWSQYADWCAKKAYEDHPNETWTIIYVDQLDVCVVFNGPQDDDEDPPDFPNFRAAERFELQGRLETAGFQVHAIATYPDDKSAIAIIVDAGRDRLASLDYIVRHIAIITTLGYVMREKSDGTTKQDMTSGSECS
jgi:hypothetical protein